MKTLYESIKSSIGIGKVAVAKKFIEDYFYGNIKNHTEVNANGDMIFDDGNIVLSVNEDGKLYLKLREENKYQEWPENINVARFVDYNGVEAHSDKVPKQLEGAVIQETKERYGGFCFRIYKGGEKFPVNAIRSFDTRLYKNGTFTIQSLDNSNTMENALNDSDFGDANLCLTALYTSGSEDYVIDFGKIKGLKCKNLLVSVSFVPFMPEVGNVDFETRFMNHEFTEVEQKAIDQFVKANDIETITFQSHNTQFGSNLYWDKQDKKYKIAFVNLSHKRRKKLK